MSTQPLIETAHWVGVGDEHMLSIAHRAGEGAPPLAVVMVVGGPQYRVGSHRQYITTARILAREGFPTLRFDYRGMGDATGQQRDFEQISDDISAAVDTAISLFETQHIVLWGLCDGASAAIMYLAHDDRVRAVIGLNPWVHSETTEAHARFRSYYLDRLVNRDLWRKILRGEFDWRTSARSLAAYVARLLPSTRPAGSDIDYIETMRRALTLRRRSLYLILSGDDLTAQEFTSLCGASNPWRRALENAEAGRLVIEAADHTFSSETWTRDAAMQAAAWLGQETAAMADDPSREAALGNEDSGQAGGSA